MSSTNKSIITRNEEYSLNWDTEDVYDRGRNQTNHSDEQESNNNNNHVFYETQTSIRSINSVDLEIDINHQIGSTKTAKVYYGTMRSNGDEYEEVAIKQLTPLSTTLQEIVRSLDSWAHIKHLNVIEIKGLCSIEDKPNELPLIVMECGKGGLLKDFIRTIEFAIPIKIQVIWGLQIINGMIEIHKNNVIHRDLASGNIVMTNNGQTVKQMEETILKIIDINDKKTFGTPLNMSPESFDEKITKESEVFSFGSILWEIVTRHREKPFADIEMSLDKFEVHTFAKCVAIENKPLKIPDYCDSRLADVIQKCRQYNPEDRPTFAELEHELNEILKTDLPDNIIQYDDHETDDSEDEIEFDVEFGESTDDDNIDVESTDTPESNESNEDYHNSIILSENHIDEHNTYVSTVDPDRANVPFLF